MSAGGGPRRPFSLIAKPTGAACNLDCSYCFFLSKEVLWESKAQAMTDDTLRAWLANFLDAQPDGPVTVGWQGGEPTLRGLAFFEDAVALAQRLKRPGQQVQHAIQTNGTLLDDAWGAFLAREQFLVGISIDGPRELHDHYRVNKAGRGTHDQVVRGLRVLQEHGVDTNVLCTVNAVNADHPLVVYRHFRDDLGAEFVQFIPIVERVEPGQEVIAESGWRDAEGAFVLYRQSGSGVTSRTVAPSSTAGSSPPSSTSGSPATSVACSCRISTSRWGRCSGSTACACTLPSAGMPWRWSTTATCTPATTTSRPATGWATWRPMTSGPCSPRDSSASSVGPSAPRCRASASSARSGGPATGAAPRTGAPPPATASPG